MALPCIGPAPPKRDQSEIARVETFLHGQQPQRAEHVLVDDVENALGRLIEIEAERPRDLLNRLFGRFDVERHFAAEQAGRQAPEHHIGVGHGRLVAAFHVASGPGTAPALSGPTRSAPVIGTCAIEPPPAPTLCTSTDGTLIG